MRLLKTDLPGPTANAPLLELVEYYGDDIPAYAILSHTWSEDEVLFADIQHQTYQRRKGFSKLNYAIEQCRKDGYHYLWADTCCIDKSSSADLSEAINSMFSWYAGAAKCYAYLVDVHQDNDLNVFTHEFRRAKWWTRGWTLQELLAQRHVEFYSTSWDFLGTKLDLQAEISEITHIDIAFLDGSRSLSTASISKRMSWAAARVTTRPEDIAYCLMGIFSVNMPLLYGEGRKAFIRLQEEIMRHSDDQSLFAWRVEAKPEDSTRHWGNDSHGLLAESPRAFLRSGQFYSYTDWASRKPYGTTNRGISIELPLTSTSLSKDICLAALQCPPLGGFDGYLAVFLKKIAGTADQYARIQCNTLGTIDQRGELRPVYVRQDSAVRSDHGVYPENFFSLRNLNEATTNIRRYRVTEYSCIAPSSAEPSVKPTGEVGATTWVKPSSGAPVSVFKVFKRGGRITVVIILRPDTRSGDPIAILLGSISDHEVGFDVCQLDEGSRKRTPIVEEYDREFSPQPMGSVAALPKLQVRVDAEERIQGGKKIYLVDIKLESAADSLYGCLPFTSFNGYSIRKAKLKRPESPTIDSFRFPSLGLDLSANWMQAPEQNGVGTSFDLNR